VIGTAAATSYSVYGGTGYNEFLVQDGYHTLDAIQGPLFLHGYDGPIPHYNFVGSSDILNSQSQNFLLTAGATPRSGVLQRFADRGLQNSDMATINYDGFNGYVALATNAGYSGQGSDTVNIQSQSADTTTVILVGTGDTVTVGNPSHTMAGILGDVSIQA